MQEGPTKNGRSRTIVIEDEITSLVLSYCHYKNNLAQKAGREVSPYLFADEKGNFIHPDTFTKHLRKIFKENGFPDSFHLHTLRHTAASLMIAGGADVATVSGLLGHSQVSTTLDIYTHAFDDKKKAASAVLQESLDI